MQQSGEFYFAAFAENQNTVDTLNGGLTPTLTDASGQVLRFRNATELAAFALSSAERGGQAGPATVAAYDPTVTWLRTVGQADIQAAANLQALARADGAAGNAQGAYLDSVGAQLAMQIQQTPPEQRQALTRRVDLGGQYAADVTVTGDADDRQGLAGFSYTVVDTDPDRTRLIAQAQDQAADAAAARAAGNALLGLLDEAQARVDVAYAGLPAGARTDKMLGVAQRFVDAGRAAAAANNWNLVQTLETAADVSLQIAAQPEGSRTTLTERFMHKGTKHDITVDPNSADPFASFKDHSKGEDAVGAIVQGVVGVVVNVVAVAFPVTAPLAVAWDAAQAGKNFAEGNILGGVLSLGAAVGVGLSGLGAVSQAGVGAAPGSFAAGASQTADGLAASLGFTGTAATATTAAVSAAQAAGQVGAEVLEGTALAGGLSGVAQSAAHGDGLGIAAGVLEAASAVAGGLVSAGTLSDPAAQAFASRVSVGAGLASVGASSADAFAHGDLAGGLLSSLGALLAQVAQRVNAATPPADPAPAGAGSGPAAPVPPSSSDGSPSGGAGGPDGDLPVPPIPPPGGPPVAGNDSTIPIPPVPPADEPTPLPPLAGTPPDAPIAVPGGGAWNDGSTRVDLGPTSLNGLPPADPQGPGAGGAPTVSGEDGNPPRIVLDGPGAGDGTAAGPAAGGAGQAGDGSSAGPGLAPPTAPPADGPPDGGTPANNDGAVPTITITAPAVDGQAATAVFVGDTGAASAAEGAMFEVAGAGLARLATTVVGRALLAAAGAEVAPAALAAVAAGGVIYLGYKGVQLLIDNGVLPQLPGFSPPPLTPPEALKGPVTPNPPNIVSTSNASSPPSNDNPPSPAVSPSDQTGSPMGPDWDPTQPPQRQDSRAGEKLDNALSEYQTRRYQVDNPQHLSVAGTPQSCGMG